MMLGQDRRIFVDRRISLGDALDVHMGLNRGHKVEVARSIVTETIEPGQAMGDPFLRLTGAEAQQLMDELYRAGVRPTEQGSPGQLKATERHLEDMQAIAIGLLRRDGVEL